ncbi:hypothetical protein RB195_024795 [Necator americanus]|uniref:Myotubularin phosphatase domain-containing protein n=1 Tax=Necator americanus TaxID=51031 RepID=A0ABR1EPQ7_NECAM
MWNSIEWIDSVQALVEDRERWAELWSSATHLGEDKGNRVCDNSSQPIKSNFKYENEYHFITVQKRREHFQCRANLIMFVSKLLQTGVNTHQYYNNR